MEVNKFWNEFTSILSSKVVCLALKLIRKTEQNVKSKPWITSGVIGSINNKNIIFKLAIEDKTKTISFYFQKVYNLLIRIFQDLYRRQIISNNKTNSQKLLEIVNNIITTRSTYCSKINGMLDECGEFVDGLKEISKK